MDLLDSPAEADFRARLRAWLRDNVPAEPEPAALADRWPGMRAFQKKMYEGGWVALSWPKEYGGQGLGPMEEAILSEELGRTNAPTTIPVSHLGRPILSHGTEEQRRRYLPPLLSGDEIWCQGFSEPGAGSDLASLRTKAVRDGDDYVITGHKTWTSLGAYADYCLLLARTDDAAPRHRGISAFILPLDLPGVEVRPIVLANGDEEFAEIHLDGARVPAANMLGAPTDGWKIAMEVVSYERGAVDIGYQAKFEHAFAELVTELADRRDDPAVLRTIGRIAANLEVLRMHSLRSLSARVAGGAPGPESSIDKLLMTEVEQHLMGASLELLRDRRAHPRSEWFDRYLYGRAGSIYGGSAQIQKNILAQRVLGLPREPQA
ncbi:acyl-CoA dehydrogenase family protein [Mycolicibacterium thermoresistibile]